VKAVRNYGRICSKSAVCESMTAAKWELYRIKRVAAKAAKN